MGIFDSDFDIEKYIRQRIPELDNLENRELFKAIVGNSTLELYRHIKSEYDALKKITPQIIAAKKFFMSSPPY